MPHAADLRVDDYLLSQSILTYQEPFSRIYLHDTYTTSSGYSLATLFDNDRARHQSFTSLDMISPKFRSKQSSFNPMLPATVLLAVDDQPSFEQTLLQAPFEELEQYNTNYAIDPASINAAELASSSPMAQSSSKTLSPCGDTQLQAHCPSMSSRRSELDSLFSPALLEDQSTLTRPRRRRGRPRLNFSDSEIHSAVSSSTKDQCTGRLPHNQVERKYREGLNSELERLRRAVPTLPHSENGGAMGQPKPSKAMVLSSAIEYIKRIEKERDALRVEVEKLK
jgi:hypothetical protein